MIVACPEILILYIVFRATLSIVKGMNINMKSVRNKCMIIAFIAIAIELFIFNFRTFESFLFKEVESFSISYSDGSKVDENNTVTFTGEDGMYIVLEGLNQTVNNLYLNITSVQNPAAALNITLSVRDQGSNQFYDLPSFEVYQNRESSKYIKLNLNGMAKSIKITLNGLSDTAININSIKLNTYRPLALSVKRLLLVFAVLIVLYAMRPGSSVYTIKYSIKRVKQRTLIVLLLAIQIFAALKINSYNPEYKAPPWEHHYQYHKLAVAFTEGHFYLDDKPSEQLLEMDNPYDRYQRDIEGVPFMWDTAFFNGKYYSYFGVLPVIIYYLPYYLATGGAFPTYVGIMINAIAIILGVFFLLNVIIKRYFENVTLGLFLIMDFTLLLGSGLLLIVTSPTFYNMPVSMAVALTVWGLYFWFIALEDSIGIKNRWLMIGALFMALVAACRPQMLVGSILVIPMFWGKIKVILKHEKNSSGKLAVNFICLAIPYIIIAGLLMYYNYARFGSPFDFGANYNLTTNDMTTRGFHLDRLPFGLFMYILQPPVFGGRYPFLLDSRVLMSYQGITIIEIMYGGFLWFNPVILGVFCFRKARSILREKKLWMFCLISVVFGLIVVCADIEMAGIVQRYGSDFGLFLTMPAVIVLLAVYEKISQNALCINIANKVLYGITVGTAGLNFLWLLVILNIR